MSPRLTDADARVLVFVDGQNVFQECRRLFGNGRCHPLLLADRLAADRKLVGVRYYSGVHDPTVNPRGRSATEHRHNLMRRVGVTVVERQLRYRWEWGFDQAELPDPRWHRGEKRPVDVSPFQRAREKGIDLAIGLDVIDLALQGHMDVAVIVSSDNDLCEAARATHAATVAGHRVSVEAALFNERRVPVVLTHYDYTQQLRRADFEACADSFDYRSAIPEQTREMFAAACQPLRANFSDA